MNVKWGMPSLSAHEPHREVSSIRVSPTSKKIALRPTRKASSKTTTMPTPTGGPGRSASFDHPEPVAVRVAEREHRRDARSHPEERRVGLDAPS
jgi:hypothetical protein